ncbi:MAG: transposase [Deltaproteobacteria bacterium]|nr:transposase [Deltaproteobacteria bacterium]
MTQRGSRRQETFFCKNDYPVYIGLMAEWCTWNKVGIRAYGLMPDHVHLSASMNERDGHWEIQS